MKYLSFLLWNNPFIECCVNNILLKQSGSSTIKVNIKKGIYLSKKLKNASLEYLNIVYAGAGQIPKPFFWPITERRSSRRVLKRYRAVKKKVPVFLQSEPNAWNLFTEAIQNIFIEFGIDSTSWGHEFFAQNQKEKKQLLRSF